MSLVNRIKKECKNHNLTLASLERSACLGNGTIRRWDSSAPAIDKLAQVANLLQVSLDYLYYGNNSIPSNHPSDEEEWLHIYRELTEGDRRECIGYAKCLLNHTAKKPIHEKRPPERSKPSAKK